MKRLFCVTGKGGVGKTLYSLALTARLKQQHQNVYYINNENEYPIELLNQLDLPFWELSAAQSIELYIAMKLHSKILAKAIVATPFFKSIFNLVPALSNLVFMGHLVHRLAEDPSLIIVVDMPASGHALTLLQSSFQLKKIFKTGVIFSDIDKMHDFLYIQNNIQIKLLTLPTLLALEESYEVKTELEAMDIQDISIILNNYLPAAFPSTNNLPSTIINKIKSEEEIVKTAPNTINQILPFIPTNDMQTLINKLAEIIDE